MNKTMILLILLTISLANLFPVSQFGCQFLFINTSARDAAFGLESGTAGLRYLSASSVSNNPAKLGALTTANYDLSFYDYSWGKFTSAALAFRWNGIGLCFPIINDENEFGTKLKYNTMGITDETNNEIGTYKPYEINRKFSIGIDVLEFGSNYNNTNTNDLSKNVKLFAGYSHNFIKSMLVPENEPNYDGESSFGEIGFLAQYLPEKTANNYFSMDYTLGINFVNPTKEEIYYINESQADPLPYGVKYAISSCMAVDLAWFNQKNPDYDTSVLSHFTDKFLVLYGSFDKANYGGIRKITGYGLEISLFDILSYRLGHTDNDETNLSGSSYSLGLNLMYNDQFGISVDYTEMFDNSKIYGPEKLNFNVKYRF
jgi:hypothetical protein